MCQGEDGTSIFDGKVANAEENENRFGGGKSARTFNAGLHIEVFQDVPFLLEIASSRSAGNTRRWMNYGVFVLTSVPPCSAPN